jgi:hypothetical protein
MVDVPGYLEALAKAEAETQSLQRRIEELEDGLHVAYEVMETFLRLGEPRLAKVRALLSPKEQP